MQELAKFEDLSDYTYLVSPLKFDGVKNIGWLDLKSKFRTGDVPHSFLEKLRKVMCDNGNFRPLVEPIRELPTCEICGDLKMVNSEGKLISNAQLWIPAEHTIFASPVSILHYIEEHNYLPPVEYIDAVCGLDVTKEFDADKIYREKHVTSGWFGVPSVVLSRP